MTGLLLADTRSIPLDDKTVQCIITSPPYWGLRDYGLSDGIGLEPTLDGYIENMRAVGRELWRVLRDDGCFFLNLGDLYWGSEGAHKPGHANPGLSKSASRGGVPRGGAYGTSGKAPADSYTTASHHLKQKDLVGLPWRVAFALQADGWYLRSDIIWAKPNPMPESVRDRPTRSHEYLFLLTKQAKYFYDAEAVAEPSTYADSGRESKKRGEFRGKTEAMPGRNAFRAVTQTRNRRTVWAIPTQPYRGAHFASFPEKLVEPCILAGTSPKACGVCGAPWERVVERRELGERNDDGRTHSKAEQRRTSSGAPPERGWEAEHNTIGWRPSCDHNDDSGQCLVLDPFCGSGTVGVVAQKHGRCFVGLDMQSKYLELAQDRIRKAPVGLGL